eukprot:evm.model.scf_1029.3 EVM.evm.TU.scf_1029.3   scf_1029:39095-48452(-)
MGLMKRRKKVDEAADPEVAAPLEDVSLELSDGDGGSSLDGSSSESGSETDGDEGWAGGDGVEVGIDGLNPGDGGDDASGSEAEGRSGGGEGGEEAERATKDPGSDSSEDERPNKNTVGNIPLEWYKHEDHIGYDLEGKKVVKQKRKDRLDMLLERMDGDGLVRTIYDDYNDEEVQISREELRTIMRIREGKFPHIEVNPEEPYNDWFSSKRRIHPLNSAPKPKSSFIPSKHEEKKIVQLVRAIRSGHLKLGRRKAKDESEGYLMWEDDNLTMDKTPAGLNYIPAPKTKLPGNSKSYNPPKEYLPLDGKEQALVGGDDENQQEESCFVPKAYEALRKVPAYGRFINEVFERCLDLYLCPRIRLKKPRERPDPQAFIPKLPKPKDLQPFPMTLHLKYDGHTGKVRSVCPDPTGQWLASAGDDGTVRLWEVQTTRCVKTWHFNTPAVCVSWCPNPSLAVIAAAVGTRVVLLPASPWNEQAGQAAVQALRVPGGSFRDDSMSAVKWVEQEGELGGVEIQHKHLVKFVTWHGQGDYFASVAPDGHSQAVIIHRLSRRASQNPFRKSKGHIVRVLFHTTKPMLFVQTDNHVRVYNLVKQTLAKKLSGSRGTMTCMAVHSGGDNVIVGGDDRRLMWFDTDLSVRPYKTLRFHKHPLRAVAFHRTYPLFASASDDGTVQVFHGMVFSDLLTNALIVPVKILRGHEVVDFAGVLDCAFHPSQPWVFTAGADGNIFLFCN